MSVCHEAHWASAVVTIFVHLDHQTSLGTQAFIALSGVQTRWYHSECEQATTDILNMSKMCWGCLQCSYSSYNIDLSKLSLLTEDILHSNSLSEVSLIWNFLFYIYISPLVKSINNNNEPTKCRSCETAPWSLHSCVKHVLSLLLFLEDFLSSIPHRRR